MKKAFIILSLVGLMITITGCSLYQNKEPVDEIINDIPVYDNEDVVLQPDTVQVPLDAGLDKTTGDTITGDTIPATITTESEKFVCGSDGKKYESESLMPKGIGRMFMAEMNDGCMKPLTTCSDEGNYPGPSQIEDNFFSYCCESLSFYKSPNPKGISFCYDPRKGEPICKDKNRYYNGDEKKLIVGIDYTCK